jgi:hypothetical protein
MCFEVTLELRLEFTALRFLSMRRFQTFSTKCSTTPSFVQIRLHMEEVWKEKWGEQEREEFKAVCFYFLFSFKAVCFYFLFCFFFSSSFAFWRSVVGCIVFCVWQEHVWANRKCD